MQISERSVNECSNVFVGGILKQRGRGQNKRSEERFTFLSCCKRNSGIIIY